MIPTIFIISFIVLFIYECTREGMVFSYVAQKLKNLPDYIKKPLFDCPICMVPWWGSLILLIGNTANIWHVHNATEWVYILFSSGGLNTIFIYIIDQGKALTKTLNEFDCNCTKKESEKEESKKRKERIAQFGIYDSPPPPKQIKKVIRANKLLKKPNR